jgi:hypothetical protein
METPLNEPSRLKKILRKTLFGLAALITLAALALAEENWRGARAWQNYKNEMEAKGEHFDAARLIPKKVPDDQNFAMSPYFAPLFDRPPGVPRQPVKTVTNVNKGAPDEPTIGLVERGANLGGYIPSSGSPKHRPATWAYAVSADLIQYAKACLDTITAYTNYYPNIVGITNPAQAASIILAHLEPCEPTLDELRRASSRPYSQFNIPWEEWDGNPQVSSAVVGHLADLKALYQLFSLRARAEMALGQSGPALDDINVMFRMDEALGEEPVIISQLVRMAGMVYLLMPVEEGLAEQHWSEDQIRILQEHLRKTDILASTARAFHGDRDICCNPSFDRVYMFPPGWNRLEQVNVNRTFQETLIPQIDLAARVINPSVNRSLDLAFQASHPTNFSAILHHSTLATMLAPALMRVPQKAALAQSGVDMAMLACALERCRLAQGQYPDDLNALVPRFAAVLPHDIINGQPLKYRRAANGGFILYSVGWNEKDDGGVVAATNADPPRQDPLQGDWVWQYPE